VRQFADAGDAAPVDAAGAAVLLDDSDVVLDDAVLDDAVLVDDSLDELLDAPLDELLDDTLDDEPRLSVL